MAQDRDRFTRTRMRVRTIQIRSAAIGAGIGLLFSVWSEPIGYGFIAGVAISLVNSLLMSADTFDMIEKTPPKVRSFVIKRFFIRFAIMFGFLALVATRTDFNIFAAFIGIFFLILVVSVSQVFEGHRSTGSVHKG